MAKAYKLFTSCTTKIDCSPIGVIELYAPFTYVLLDGRGSQRNRRVMGPEGTAGTMINLPGLFGSRWETPRLPATVGYPNPNEVPCTGSSSFAAAGMEPRYGLRAGVVWFSIFGNLLPSVPLPSPPGLLASQRSSDFAGFFSLVFPWSTEQW
jgi:hypothetical protein